MCSWTENIIKIPSWKIRLESDDVAVLPINRNRVEKHMFIEKHDWIVKIPGDLKYDVKGLRE